MSEEDRSALLFALNQQQPYEVRFSDGTFVGVNVGACPHLIVEHSEGAWSAGRVLDAEGQVRA